MREKLTAAVLLVVLAFYCVTIGWRGVLLLDDGRATPVLLGLAVLLVPVVAVVAMVPLVRLARDGARMLSQAHTGDVAPAVVRELERAEECRVARDRSGEQRHYRAAVRAWRDSRR